MSKLETVVQLLDQGGPSEVSGVPAEMALFRGLGNTAVIDRFNREWDLAGVVFPDSPLPDADGRAHLYRRSAEEWTVLTALSYLLMRKIEEVSDPVPPVPRMRIAGFVVPDHEHLVVGAERPEARPDSPSLEERMSWWDALRLDTPDGQPELILAWLEGLGKIGGAAITLAEAQPLEEEPVAGGPAHTLAFRSRGVVAASAAASLGFRYGVTIRPDIARDNPASRIPLHRQPSSSWMGVMSVVRTMGQEILNTSAAAFPGADIRAFTEIGGDGTSVTMYATERRERPSAEAGQYVLPTFSSPA